jgi:hypothetical protein
LFFFIFQCDQADSKYAKDWITDFESFETALRERDGNSVNLASSLALTLEEFYNKIDHAVVSAYDGYGMNEFFCAVQKAVSDYELYVNYFKLMYSFSVVSSLIRIGIQVSN